MSEAIYTTQDVIKKLVSILKEEGSLLLAQVPDRLRPIDYRQFTTGKLKPWLREFPEFAFSEDDLSIVLAGQQRLRQTTDSDSAAVPAVLPEVRYMHSFAYMGFWTPNLKRLKNLGEFPDLKADVLRDTLGRRLMQGLLLGHIKTIEAENQQPYLVVDTGLYTQDDHSVYAVMEINPVNKDGTKQFWAMKGFCSDSEMDQSELGRWFRTQISGGLSFDHTDLQERLQQLSTQKDAMLAAVNLFRTALEEGLCPELADGRRLSQLVTQYESQWESLLSFLEGYPGVDPEEMISISKLQDVANRDSFRNNLLRQALELFEGIVAGMRKFFEEYGWDAGENCTPAQDMALLQQSCNSVFFDAEEFRGTLAAYRAFRDAVSTTKADEDYYANVTAATEHFCELPQFRTTAKLLRGTPMEERAFLDRLDEIDPLLNQYQLIQSEANVAGDPILPDNNRDLLAIALQADQKYLRNWHQYVKEALPADPRLQEIIVPSAQDTDAELTCSAVANRLLHENQPALAERYWILGLQFEPTKCATHLLTYYRETKQEEAFAVIWTRFHEQIAYSPLDEMFWFGAICQQDPEQALQMGQDNIHLQYQPDYLSNLIHAAERLGKDQLAETFRNRLSRFREYTEPNAFEAAVIADDRDQIMALSLPETLQNMGYDSQQILRIQSAVETGEYPAGSSPYDVGRRLYAFQGNCHSLAEQWLWRGVSKQNRGSYGILLLVLTNEHRWEEAIALYTRHAESQKRFEDCRRLYIIAQYYHSPLKAQEAIRENLQDALSILNSRPTFREKFSATAQQEGCEMYALLLKLHASTTANPYLWSVICEDRSLRDQVGDETLLATMGLDAATISEAHRSGNYPHGRDAASIAYRLYALADNYASGAEAAALIAENSPAARKLLWTIYQQQKNETAMYALLSEDLALQKEHYAQYMALVFARGEFETFLTLLEESGDLSEQLLMQRAIAELTLGRELTDSAEVCAEAATSCAPELCMDLLRAAVDQEELTVNVIITCFEQWLSLPAQQLQALVTCDAGATPQMLERLQNEALQRQNVLLVVYLYNVLKIGNAEETSEQLYRQLQDQLTVGDQIQQNDCLHKLQILYRDRAGALSRQAVSVSIRSVFLQDPNADSQQIAAKLAEVIGSLKNDPDAFDFMLSELQGSPFCQEPQVYTAIRDYAKQIGRPTDVLLFFHREGQEGNVNPMFRDYLIQLYWNALVESRFPQQIAEEAEAICFQCMQQKDSRDFVFAALNIAMLRQLADQPIYAHAVLGYLAEVMGSQANLEQALSNTLDMDQFPAVLQLPDPLPDPLQLFEQILDQGSAEQVLYYIFFCQKFVEPEDVSAQTLQDMLENRDALEDQNMPKQSIRAIQLLCSEPRRREFWELCYRIPFNVSEIGRAAFLELYCQNVPGHQKEYVQLCETLSTNSKRLANALLDWCLARNQKDHDAFRQYVETKLAEEPSYLENLNESEIMVNMVKKLCESVKSAKELIHAQLLAVTRIAVLTGDSCCLKVLQQELGYLLFGSKGDLGVAALCNLLLAGRFEEATKWLDQLHNSVARLACRPLVEKLAGYSDEERENWVQNPINRMHLELFLPNGTPPSYERINQLVCSAVLEGTEGEATAVLQQNLLMFPHDYVTAYELFTLCKTDLHGNFSGLHASLVALVQLASNPESQKYAKRTSDCDPQTLYASLAILNQLIVHNQVVDSIQDGWDFGQSTARGLADRNVVGPDAARVSSLEQTVRDSLAFQSPEISNLRAQAWLANITGNWVNYLQQAFQSQVPEAVFFPSEVVSYLGFAQSILRLISHTSADAIPYLLEWLENLPLNQEKPDHWNRQRNWALAFYRKGALSQLQQVDEELAEQLLLFPMDNGRLCGRLIFTVLEPLLSAAPEQIYTIASMIAFLGGRYALFRLYCLANKCFQESRDGTAWALFSVLYQVSGLWSIGHTGKSDFSKLAATKSLTYEREEYQSKMRVCGAFYGDAACLETLANPNINPWTNINMIIVLATMRPDELGRLIALQHPDCMRFSQQVCKILNKNVTDADKLEILDDSSFTELQRYYLSQMLSYRDTVSREIYYLQSEEAQMKALNWNTSIYRSYTSSRPDLAKNCKKAMLYKSLRAIVLMNTDALATECPVRNPSAIAGRTWDEQVTGRFGDETPAALVATSQNTALYIAPDYAAHLTPLGPDVQALQELQRQYRKACSPAAKAELSQQIYRYVIGTHENPAKHYCALIQYSVDQFYALYREPESTSRQKAFQMLLTLLETDNCNVQAGPEYNALVNLVNEVGATGLIQSCSKIQDLAKQYVAHVEAFGTLQQMVQDKMVQQNLSILYAVLKQLEQDYERFGTADTDKLVLSLNGANKKISAMNNHGDIKFHLRRILDTEISALSRRAILEVTLLSQGPQAHNGVLSGWIINKGLLKAEELTLQAFCHSFVSPRYELKQLLPGEKAIFEIAYACDETTETLNGHLSVTGTSGDLKVGAECEISIALGSTSGDDLPFNAYSTDRTAFVVDEETGRISNSSFFGRNTETARLRELVAGDNFANFHSAIVYGVRRTGKTYLLEYFKTYVQHTHPECICIRIDAQGSNVTIHSVFIQRVLDDKIVSTVLNCSDKDAQDIAAFKCKWENYATDDGEMDPNLIKIFYQELYELTGRGLFLLIDEMDRLLQKLEDDHQEANLNNLLQALSSLLDDDERKKYLQLVICGSNWLMYYASVGPDMQQLFQRVGDYKISVGRLPKEDVLAVLRSVDIPYAAGTQEMIWEFTGGLVWFVKLLANAAIRRAKDARRNCVYPSDVFYSLATVVNRQNCDQFYEGCKPGTAERQMIDAMQSLAYRKGRYLSLSDVGERLDMDTAAVEKALGQLIYFEIAERHPADPNRVRFTLDIYRRFFRSLYSVYPRTRDENLVFEQPNDTGYSVTFSSGEEMYSDDDEL